MTIQEIQQKIVSALVLAGFLVIETREEYLASNPHEDPSDWSEGDYLIVYDREEHEVLGGAFSIHHEEGVLTMTWLPYPEKPYIGLTAIINRLNFAIESYVK